MKQFQQMKVGYLPSINMETVGGAHYYIKEGKEAYPSVTTILYETGDHSGIDRWKMREGEEVANHILKTSSAIGKAVHDLNFDYVNNVNMVNKINSAPLLAEAHHIKMRKYMDKIDTVFATEAKLCSDIHRFAGTTDCVAIYEGKMSVIDYKTNRSPKKEEYLLDYYLQLAGYAIMWEEMTGMVVDQGVLIISTEKNTLHEKIVDVEKYKELFLDRVRLYQTDLS